MAACSGGCVQSEETVTHDASATGTGKPAAAAEAATAAVAAATAAAVRPVGSENSCFIISGSVLVVSH